MSRIREQGKGNFRAKTLCRHHLVDKEQGTRNRGWRAVRLEAKEE